MWRYVLCNSVAVTLIGAALLTHLLFHDRDHTRTHYPGQDQAETTLPDLMHRLMMVESGGDPDARSPAGACGLYQIMQPTWEDMTDVSYNRCTDSMINEMVAWKYLRWLDSTLERWMGRVPTDRDILAAWNGGIGRFRSRKYDLKSMPQETREFVERVMQ